MLFAAKSCLQKFLPAARLYLIPFFLSREHYFFVSKVCITNFQSQILRCRSMNNSSYKERKSGGKLGEGSIFSVHRKWRNTHKLNVIKELYLGMLYLLASRYVISTANGAFLSHRFIHLHRWQSHSPKCEWEYLYVAWIQWKLTLGKCCHT